VLYVTPKIAPRNAYPNEPSPPKPYHSRHRAQQLRLQNVLALLVLLAGLIGLVVLPADRLLALSAVDVAYDVAAGRHVALVGLGFGHVDDAVEEVCFAVLAAEVLGYVSMGYARV
jgi:hypothetical protein